MSHIGNFCSKHQRTATAFLVARISEHVETRSRADRFLLSLQALNARIAALVTQRSGIQMKMMKRSALFFLLFQILPACGGDDTEPGTDAGVDSTSTAGAGGTGAAGK